PHSLWAKDVDEYTFLPSVLDSRRGVCLGVSILYLSIAQRLDLPLEIITPPGHIYVRYNDEGKHINIETTARGISPPSDSYLGINTYNLQERTIKEVIGLAFINQASVSFQKQEFEEAVKLYEKALPFLPGNPLLKMLLGYCYLFTNQTKKGEKLMRAIENIAFADAVSKETTPEDYLNGKVSSEGIKIIFQSVDENRASILKKQKALEEIIKKYPKFRDGLFHLAITYLQLGRGHEATEILRAYHKIDCTNPTVEYYLAVLGMQRYNYVEAWKHLHIAKKLTAERDHKPECLRGLHHELRRVCPNPL
ncbi:MAG: tetratricopeptide repeat protein, partial [Simkaniaceae bacterium]|nr:tetratricopeptide repeat protein [Simkaniaceae bacterium]